jgi:hypothetical protein
LKQVGDNGLEQVVHLGSSSPVVANDQSNRVVSGPRKTEIVGEQADLSPGLGNG